MAYGVVDLDAAVTPDDFVSALEREVAGEKDAQQPLEVWVNAVAGRTRVTMFALCGNVWLGRVIARVGSGVERGARSRPR